MDDFQQYPPGLLSALGLNPEDLRRQQQQAGLLSAGLQLLAGSGYSPVRQTTGQLLGQAGMAGVQGMQQVGETAIDRALKGLQVQQFQRQQQEAERQLQARKAFESRLAGATTMQPTAADVLATQSNIDPALLEQMSARDVIGAAPKTQAVTDQAAADRALADYLRIAAPVEYAKLMVKEPKQLPAAIQEFAFAKTPEGGGFKGTFQEFLQSKTPSTNVSLSTEKSYGGALAGEVAKSDAAKFEAANAAPRVIDTVNATRSLLDSGNVITGIGAQQRLDLARFGQLLGVTGKNTNEVIANTQQLFANRAQATLDSIRSSGLGAGQGFSNKDREFLENARLGNITYSPEALKRQLDIEENVAKASVSSWNNRLKNIPLESRQALGLGEVTMPTTTQPKRIPRYNPATGRVE